MPDYKLRINGLGYHDFKNRLDELYEHAPGRRMSISIEHDNVAEQDAVIVYWGKYFVGYVRSGKDRELALSLIQASGRATMLGKITGIDRDNRWLWMEISCQLEPTPTKNSPSTILADWHFEGKTLRLDENEEKLHTMLCNLEMTAEQQDPWDEEMEQWLEYCEENLWLDISRETSEQVTRIFDLLTDGSGTRLEYKKAANRLQSAVDKMGSPSTRRRQAEQIIQKAHSHDMNVLLLHYGDKAKECVRQLPQVLIDLFLEDGEIFMGRLWYLHRPTKQIQAIKTLLAMMIRLKDNEEKKVAPSIPEQWLIAWGSRQQDRAKAEVVQEIVETFEMEKSNPKLAREIQLMIDRCNVPLQQTKLLEGIALQPRTENHFTEGSVRIGAGGTLMGNVNTNE